MTVRPVDFCLWPRRRVRHRLAFQTHEALAELALLFQELEKLTDLEAQECDFSGSADPTLVAVWQLALSRSVITSVMARFISILIS